MVWARDFVGGKMELVVVNGTLNANEYVNMLDTYFLLFRDEYYSNRCVF